MAAKTNLNTNGTGIVARLVRRVLAPFLVAVASLGLFAAPASAASTPAPSVSGTVTCVTTGAANPAKDADGLSLLPLDRWADSSTSLHSRLGKSATDDLMEKINRGLIQSGAVKGMGLAYGFTEIASSMAARSNPVCAAAPVVDGMAGRLGRSILDSPIIGVLMAAGFVTLLFRARKQLSGAVLWRGMARMIASVVALLIVLNGAAATTQTGTTVKLGTFSPSWWANVTNDSIVKLSEAPMCALQNLAVDDGCKGPNSTDGSTTDTGLDCAKYTTALVAGFRAKAGDSAEARSALAVDALWRSTAIDAFNAVQFGTNNKAASRVSCFILEQGAKASGKSISDRIGPLNGSKVNARVFELAESKQIDRLGIQLAVCEFRDGAWAANPEFEKMLNPDGYIEPTETLPDPDNKTIGSDAARICDNWWKLAHFNSDTGYAWSEVSDSPSTINRLTQDAPAARNFLLSWHGDSLSATVYMVAGFISAVAVAISVGLLSLAIFLSKLFLECLLALAALFLVASIFPTVKGASHLARYAKLCFGLLVFSTVSEIVLGLVNAFSVVGAGVGGSMFGEDSAVGLLFKGLLPAGGLLMVHFGAKALKMPTPFKPHSGIGMATAFAGSAGGAALAIKGLEHRGRALRQRGMSNLGFRRGGRGGVMGSGRGAAGRTPDSQAMRPSGRSPFGPGREAAGPTGPAGPGSAKMPKGVRVPKPGERGAQAGSRLTNAMGIDSRGARRVLAQERLANGGRATLAGYGRAIRTGATDSARRMRFDAQHAPAKGRRFGAAAAVGMAAATVATGGAAMMIPMAATAYVGARAAHRTGRTVAGSRVGQTVNPWSAQHRGGRQDWQQARQERVEQSAPARPAPAQRPAPAPRPPASTQPHRRWTPPVPADGSRPWTQPDPNKRLG